MATSASPTPDHDFSHAALGGLRVLDLSRVIAGPWSAQVLVDLGADVIKVERPRVGDDSRAWAPPYMRDRDGRNVEQAVQFAACNRGKRSIELDLANPEDAEVLRKLAATADVLIENYKVGTLHKYGFDHETLSQSNPGLIYCSITGFGQTGPYRDRPGYDTIMQGMSGLMSLTGHPDGEAGGGPLKTGLPVIDLATGLYATIGILAALQRRTVTGRGQLVDMALLDVGVSSLAHLGLRYLTGNGTPSRQGNRLPMVAPTDAFACRDGRVMVIVGNDRQFHSLCKVLEVPELAEDERFATNPQRLANSAALYGVLNHAFRQIDTEACVEKCSQHGVPCGPIYEVSDVFDDPQVKARGLVQWLAHSPQGEVPAIGSPMRFSESVTTGVGAAPALGEHNEEIKTALSQGAALAWPQRRAG
ncbi:CaiB/BaiF CoA-transferase family protein [Hydrogenophaga sp.]|uniref:CaiB/BaiF CoA transferase family protein n=1 Tax=Hydrogenophaga sp. TaxID=1904254 RepID=UPI00272939A9|nr:CoA transferase [Hydrogenophaga sp.]MDO9435751.1 CoA transferase [Hydrogenophaga sp.]